MTADQPVPTDTAHAARPNAPGLWKFTGSVTTRQGEADEMTLVLDRWTLRIVAEEGELVITDPDTGIPLGGAWVGQWEAQPSAP